MARSQGVVPRVAPGRGTVLINTGKGTLMANDAGVFVEKAGHGRGRRAITTVSAWVVGQFELSLLRGL
jgi:hypothetical protein